MPEMNVIVREPLLDAQQRTIGYALAWQQAEIDACRSDVANPTTLAGLVAEAINDEQAGWRLGDQVLFLEAAPELLLADVLTALPAKNIVLVINASDCVDVDSVTVLQALRKQGFGIALRWSGLAEPDKALLPLATHIEIAVSKTDFAMQARQYALIKHLPVHKVARHIASWNDYDACVSLGFDLLAGPFQLMPRPDIASKGLNTSQVLIVQLLEMVRKNADVRQIEVVLKRDPVVSYKLLRYINSAGFGLGCEIESLRHAVQVLGYTPLYRWLSVLLATASTSKSAQLLMQTAITRGRLAELLGDTFLPKAETENLFVAGLFSLLDRLLGIPMAEVLDKIQLPEAMSQALLDREGIYGDFLALAEACERGAGCAGKLAASLQIDATQVSQKHLSALAWAQNINV
jgi:EAL and modified HD-GYP domain-containing signal transduction protein